MKIIKLQLDHFGKFEDYTMELGPGFHVIYGDNEEGKSTLMAFIQMMFYGYGGRSRDLSGHLRRKYRPWKGGEMKGQIQFESAGTVYRLERTFGQSNSTDQVSLWNETTGERVRLSSKNDPGSEFFGLGEDAFARSVFISQGASNIQGAGRSDEITQCLSNLVTTGSEEISYQEAGEHLQKALAALVSKNQKNGRLIQAQAELNRLDQARRQAAEEEAEKISVQEQLEAMEQEKQKLAAQRDGLAARLRMHSLALQRDQYRQALDRENQLKTLEDRLAAMEARLQSDHGVVDGTFLQRAEELREEWDGLDQKQADLDLELRRIRAERSDLEIRSPRKILPETFSFARQGGEELHRLKQNIRDLEGEIGDREEFLAQSEGIRALEEALAEGEMALTDAQEEADRIRRTAEAAGADLASERQHLEDVRLRQMEGKIARDALAYRVTARAQELETARLENLRILEASASPHPDETVGASANRAMFLPAGIAVIAIGLGLWGLIYGISKDPLYLAALPTALLLLYWSFGRYRKLAAAATARSAQLELTLRRRGEARTALARIDADTADLDRLRLELAEGEEALIQLEERLDASRKTVASLEDALTAAQKLQTEATMELAQARARWQSLKQTLDQENEEIAARKVQGSRLDLHARKAELEDLRAQADRLEKKISEMFQSAGVGDLNELTTAYYDGISHGDQLKKILADEARLKQQLDAASQRQGELRETLIRHLSSYQSIGTLEEGHLMMEELKRDLGELEKIRIQAESARAHRQDPEKNLTREELKLGLESAQAELQDKEALLLGEIPDEAEAERIRVRDGELLRAIAELDRSAAGIFAEAKEKFRNRPNLSQIEERRSQCEETVRQYREDHAALKLADEVMAEAFEEMQQSFGPLLNDATARIFTRLTGGKYRGVRVNRTFDIAVEDRHHNNLREWGYLSGGTVDQAYLSLRLAISDLITNHQEPLPLFLDDVFTQYDDDRAREGLEFLLEHTRDREDPLQAVLFTCHARIRDWARSNPQTKVLDLSPQPAR